MISETYFFRNTAYVESSELLWPFKTRETHILDLSATNLAWLSLALWIPNLMHAALKESKHSLFHTRRENAAAPDSPPPHTSSSPQEKPHNTTREFSSYCKACAREMAFSGIFLRWMREKRKVFLRGPRFAGAEKFFGSLIAPEGRFCSPEMVYLCNEANNSSWGCFCFIFIARSLPKALFFYYTAKR